MAMAMGDDDHKKKKLHAIMISVPYQGHINPFVNLALLLASKGILVTFVHFEAVHHRLSSFHNLPPAGFNLFAGSGLDIRYTTISDGLHPLDYDRDIHFEDYWKIIMLQFQPRVDDFVGTLIRSNPDFAHFLVADTVFSWPAATAAKYGLVNVSFWTQPALIFTVAYHLDLMKQHHHYPYTDDGDEEINYIPGVKSINSKDLMSFVKEPMETRIINRSTYEVFREVKKADFVLHNTVQELESHTLSALSEYHPTYAIGPVNFAKNLPPIAMARSLWSETDCTSWLDSKPPGSVLYVSFGSFVHTNKELLKELANGLLLSGVNFLWVIREGILGSGGGAAVPEGYEEAVGSRAMIIPWCNQVKVLSNPSIGGFLSHCGWNSTVESIWCGVPMICYPMLYDQPTNRKLIVDDWTVGINLCDGDRVDRIEVADKIKKFMSGDTALRLRNQAQTMKKILKNAVEIDGSSTTNLDRFIHDLKAKMYGHPVNTS
ncbi:UDP-glycosyltransferase 86A1-like [Andrographis paniculata]|uniref:UDP-glycosyltransferase 86A1-like n=1 Tax=Andrographis paniculata TaxID=175694 RepID=UPI001E7A8CBC|nr:UDP-glycosyltransferase 86A1-like [Andrographis paniculata]QZJ84693.1 UDP-glycosyltransferase 22 [Andrographis paniculata]